MINNCSQSSENRRHPRFILMLPLEITLGDFCIQTQTRNVSCTGLYCKVDRFIPKETEIKVNMKISFTIDAHKVNKTINCPAKVVHIIPPNPCRNADYDIGIEFLNLRVADKGLLLKYIKKKNTKEAKELKRIYLELKQMAARLIEVEECHPTAEHFRRVIDRAVEELDTVAHILDFEINELKNLE
ncbi:MAG: PilZ domain-containing protein [Candidatus Omnitrophica bacterium]|nr:PilZ domain-containing protein [Candidatus Omnitrophota bacterium]